MEVRLYSISVFYQMKFGNSHECCFIFYLESSWQKRVKNNKQANEKKSLLTAATIAQIANCVLDCS